MLFLLGLLLFVCAAVHRPRLVGLDFDTINRTPGKPGDSEGDTEERTVYFPPRARYRCLHSCRNAINRVRYLQLIVVSLHVMEVLTAGTL